MTAVPLAAKIGAAAMSGWVLVGLNPTLGNRRPLDLIRRGQARELLDAIASERAGSFA